jgi:hypothetical protein
LCDVGGGRWTVGGKAERRNADNLDEKRVVERRSVNSGGPCC